MDRQYYLDLAAQGLRMPISTDLVLHEQADPAAIVMDGAQLGRVIETAARRLGTPLAFPHMDLELEKAAMLEMLGVPEEASSTFHFTEKPSAAMFQQLTDGLKAGTLHPRLQAHIESIRYIAEQTDLLPIGMVIGPFSLATKLVADPITPVALAGMGMTEEDAEEIGILKEAQELGMRMILHSVAAQIDAGAKAIFVAEPAANKVYFSPNQMEDGSDVFDRFVMDYNRQLKAYLEDRGVDLIFHDCGELIDAMVVKITELRPVLLSLGSSRNLAHDAALVPKDIVLFGNLPSKQFYSDALITVAQVRERSNALVQVMQEAGHPFILGTECDVLSVPGSEKTICAKLAAMTRDRHGVCIAS
jgi:uroporphyrinogen-III decarboxylase